MQMQCLCYLFYVYMMQLFDQMLVYYVLCEYL